MKILLSGILLSLVSVTAFAAPLPGKYVDTNKKSSIFITPGGSASVSFKTANDVKCSPDTDIKYTLHGEKIITFGSTAPGVRFYAKGSYSGDLIIIDTIEQTGCSRADEISFNSSHFFRQESYKK